MYIIFRNPVLPSSMGSSTWLYSDQHRPANFRIDHHSDTGTQTIPLTVDTVFTANEDCTVFVSNARDHDIFTFEVVPGAKVICSTRPFDEEAIRDNLDGVLIWAGPATNEGGFQVLPFDNGVLTPWDRYFPTRFSIWYDSEEGPSPIGADEPEVMDVSGTFEASDMSGQDIGTVSLNEGDIVLCSTHPIYGMNPFTEFYSSGVYKWIGPADFGGGLRVLVIVRN